MSNQIKFHPANSTEFGRFFVDFCLNCVHGRYELHQDECKDKPCEIIAKAFFFAVDDPNFPSEWAYDDKGKPACTAYKPDVFDWDKGTYPNQLELPFNDG